jgi:hypothetical protein
LEVEEVAEFDADSEDFDDEPEVDFDGRESVR